MPYFKTSQEWLDHSVALLEARPSSVSLTPNLSQNFQKEKKKKRKRANPSNISHLPDSRHYQILHQTRQAPQTNRHHHQLRRRINNSPFRPQTPARQPRPQDVRSRQRRGAQVPHHKGRRGYAPHVRRAGPPGQGHGWHSGRAGGDDAGC